LLTSNRPAEQPHCNPTSGDGSREQGGFSDARHKSDLVSVAVTSEREVPVCPDRRPQLAGLARQKGRDQR